MRRMYSEQELTKVIKEVFEAELASGALDENVSDAVDAYLLEHPVDITALEGQDVELNSLDATGLITGGEIVEKMSGYSYSSPTKENITKEILYAGVVKNGNKITFCIYTKLTRTGSVDENNLALGIFTIPASIGSKLYPATSNWLEFKRLYCGSNYNAGEEVNGLVIKTSGTQLTFIIYDVNNKFTENTDYYCRFETTFLLSDSLAE